jgi:hypothetical protein
VTPPSAFANTPNPTLTLTNTSAPTPLPASDPTPALASALPSLGPYYVQVTANPGSDLGVPLRTNPGIAYSIVSRLQEGTTVELVGGPRTAGGRVWWEVKTIGPDVYEGWVGEEFLRPVADQ